MDDATRICALLLRDGAVPRSRVPELDDSNVRSDVERRLADVGLLLATSAYSDHVALRLSADVTAGSDFDAATNVGLKADHCALLVILWARLVLQKRTAADTRDLPGQESLLPADRRDAAQQYVPQVRVETLAQEFGEVLGKKTRIKQLVATLRRLHFVAGRGDTLEAGPLLELGIDGASMVTFIRREVLAKLVSSGDTGSDPDEMARQPQDELLAVIRGAGGTVGMSDLRKLTGERPDQLRALLRALETDGRVIRTGTRATTRYHVSQT